MNKYTIVDNGSDYKAYKNDELLSSADLSTELNKLNKLHKRAIAERNHAIDIEDHIPTSIWHGVVEMIERTK